MGEDKIVSIFKEAGFSLSDEDVEKFLIYLRELKRWNRVHNLTAVEDEEDIVRRHFLDSLSLAKCFSDLRIDWKGRDIADVGSGAGFPGVPLKIYLKDFNLFLVESVGKKCSFLEFLKVKLGLEWEVICERAEKLERKFYIVIARALGEFEEIVPILERLSERYVFVMKGKRIEDRWIRDFGYKKYRVKLKGLPESYILYKLNLK